MAELGLAVVGTVDLCFKYGKLLCDAYESYKAAESELSEKIIRLQSMWLRTSSQLKFLLSVWQSLDEAHQNIQSQMVEILAGKLKIALSKIESVTHSDSSGRQQNDGKIKRWKYVILKEGIEKSLEEVEAWQKMFDPSWFLIMKISSTSIDRELANTAPKSKDSALDSATSLRDAVHPMPGEKVSIFLPTEGLNLDFDKVIPFSSFRLVQRKGSSRWLLFETVEKPLGVDPAAFHKDVRNISRRLSHVQPLTFRLLNCYGVIRHMESGEQHPTSFTFVYRVPEGFSNPHSLRKVLLKKTTDHSLSERFQIAIDLARAVSYVHSFGFVHKNVRPESVVLFRDGQSPLGVPFLAGFQVFRDADGRTVRLGDSDWQLNLYRHPQRQGLNPVKDYIMQHDIYSLGVCLLELGLFESFVVVRGDGDEQVESPSPLLGLSSKHFATQAKIVKERLVTLARQDLPKKMGTKYANIVVTCLTCLDKDNADFGDDSAFRDEDGILVNVRYIEKVLVQLSEISI